MDAGDDGHGITLQPVLVERFDIDILLRLSSRPGSRSHLSPRCGRPVATSSREQFHPLGLFGLSRRLQVIRHGSSLVHAAADRRQTCSVGLLEGSCRLGRRCRSAQHVPSRSPAPGALLLRPSGRRLGGVPRGLEAASCCCAPVSAMEVRPSVRGIEMPRRGVPSSPEMRWSARRSSHIIHGRHHGSSVLYEDIGLTFGFPCKS